MRNHQKAQVPNKVYNVPNYQKNCQKIGSFSLIERVILSAGAMLIFSVSFQIDQMPEGEGNSAH